jgi:hypothetical protein
MAFAMLKRIIVLAFAVVCSRPAIAQEGTSLEHRQWEATGFAGGDFATNFHLPTPVSGSAQESSRTVGMRHSSGYEIGARIIDNFKPYWSGDLEYSFGHEDLRFTNLSPAIPSLSLTQYIHRLSYNLAYLPLPPLKRFRPYGDVGVGTALYFLPGESKETASGQGLNLRDSWVFVVNCGGGFRYLLKDQFAFALDLKDQLSNVPSYGLPDSTRVINGQYQPGIFTHGVAQSWRLNFGLTFQWDQ